MLRCINSMFLEIVRNVTKRALCIVCKSCFVVISL